MFRNKLFTILLFGSLCASVTTAGAEVIFSDSFESGDTLSTNADGFAWDGNNRTSVVTQDAADGSVKLWENKVAYEILSDLMPDGSDRDYTTDFGNNTLRFKYYALDSGIKEPQWTEQRFALGKGYPELWISYNIRVPLNYVRGPDNPGIAGRNGKWMQLSMGTVQQAYAGGVSYVVVSDWPNYLDSSSMDLEFQLYDAVGNTYPTSVKYKNFVTPADAGRWMQVIYRLQTESSPGASDGIVEIYRKWANEPAFTKVLGLTDVPSSVSPDSITNGYEGWGGGYFMGFANDPYAKETEWLVDDFTVSTTSLVPNPPLPPSPVSGTKTTVE